MVSLQNYTVEQMQDALMKYAVYGNTLKVSKENDIPEGTLRNWLKDEDNIRFIAKYREKNLLDFDEKSASIIEDMLNLMKLKVQKAINGEEELKITELTGAIGMLYDKRAESKGIKTNGNIVNIAIQLNGDGLPESIVKEI